MTQTNDLPKSFTLPSMPITTLKTLSNAHHNTLNNDPTGLPSPPRVVDLLHSPSSNATKLVSRESPSAVKCQICKGGNHEALNCPQHFNHAYQPETLPLVLPALTLHDFNDANAWLPDTGVGAHMTNATGILSNVRPYSGNTCIVVGNGNILDVSHIGDTSLPLSNGSHLLIKDVLVVPGIQKSAYPYICEFSDSSFVIKDKRAGMMLTKGTRMGGMYILFP